LGEAARAYGDQGGRVAAKSWAVGESAKFHARDSLRFPSTAPIAITGFGFEVACSWL